ncbi:hypothetical protein FF3_00677 [Fretibacterium fastidiosum]
MEKSTWSSRRKALMGKKAGDEVELKTSRLTRYAVESVS